MRFTTLAICLLIACASHAELTIFEVQRNLAMAEGEKVYHDFYVDGGSEAGLKTGMTLTVQRRLALFDYYRNREVSALALKVARVKVIQVQDGLSVVRLTEEISREDAPISDEHFIMIGDHLDFGPTVAEATVAPEVPAAATPTATITAAPAATPAPQPVGDVPAARIVVNSVDLTIDERKKTEATPPAAPPTPAVK